MNNSNSTALSNEWETRLVLERNSELVCWQHLSVASELRIVCVALELFRPMASSAALITHGSWVATPIRSRHVTVYCSPNIVFEIIQLAALWSRVKLIASYSWNSVLTHAWSKWFLRLMYFVVLTINWFFYTWTIKIETNLAVSPDESQELWELHQGNGDCEDNELKKYESVGN